MIAFQLSYDRILQGDFSLGKLNLFFVFQVNCPGCFMYGFPQMERLHQQYKFHGLTVLGLATAFEDFEHNTTANVQLLLSEQKTIGMTKRALGDTYTQAISFPIASDRLTTGKELTIPENLELFCHRVSGYENMSSVHKAQLQQKIASHLQQFSRTSATFALNCLQGTPSFVLCDRDLQILDQWFGHVSDAKVLNRIERYFQPPILQ